MVFDRLAVAPQNRNIKWDLKKITVSICQFTGRTFQEDERFAYITQFRRRKNVENLWNGYNEHLTVQRPDLMNRILSNVQIQSECKALLQDEVFVCLTWDICFVWILGMSAVQMFTSITLKKQVLERSFDFVPLGINWVDAEERATTQHFSGNLFFFFTSSQ